MESLTQETNEEIDKLKSEKLQTEVDFKNAELASSTMNLIYKNQFISHIKSDLTNIAKRSSSDELINELNLSIQDQIEIISQLRLTIEEEKLLVSQLELTVQEQQAIIDALGEQKSNITLFIIIGILVVLLLVSFFRRK